MSDTSLRFAVTPASPGDPCENCGRTEYVVTIRRVRGRSRSPRLRWCIRCLAASIDLVMDWRLYKTVELGIGQLATAAAIRADRDAREVRARQRG